jgi:hypothetical protein
MANVGKLGRKNQTPREHVQKASLRMRVGSDRVFRSGDGRKKHTKNEMKLSSET